MKFIFCIFLFSFAALTQAQLQVIEIDSNNRPAVPAENLPAGTQKVKNGINYEDSLVLGLVEGMTEYLPVSSTGHLILANAFLKLDSPAYLLDANGKQILDENLKPYTMKDASDAYAIVIQFGAILAIAILYWQYMLKMLMGLLGRNPEGLKLLINLTAAFLPAAIIGLVLHNFIETYLFGVKPVVFALAAGALLMFAIQKYYKKREKNHLQFVKIEDLDIRQSLIVGVLQCVAMWPGMSRSMMTILGGYLVGMRPADSAKFSFLLGLMTLSAASFYKTYMDGEAMLSTLSTGPFVLGLVVAFVSAAVSVKWMVGFLTKRGLAPFAWYRIALAAVLCIMMYFDILS